MSHVDEHVTSLGLDTAANPFEFYKEAVAEKQLNLPAPSVGEAIDRRSLRNLGGKYKFNSLRRFALARETLSCPACTICNQLFPHEMLEERRVIADGKVFGGPEVGVFSACLKTPAFLDSL